MARRFAREYGATKAGFFTIMDKPRIQLLDTQISEEHWSGGGPWTEIKLDAVEYYLKCYTSALKRVGFQLAYIDAFAGTGARVTRRVAGGLIEGGPLRTVREILAGSALRALAVEPPFDRLIFIEKNAKRSEALSEIGAGHPNRSVKIITGEANEVLRDLAPQHPWVLKEQSNSRGVVFLDPFALQVDWKTLQALASTRVLDVWYLFPIRDTIRQLARNFSGIGPKGAHARSASRPRMARAL